MAVDLSNDLRTIGRSATRSALERLRDAVNALIDPTSREGLGIQYKISLGEVAKGGQAAISFTDLVYKKSVQWWDGSRLVVPEGYGGMYHVDWSLAVLRNEVGKGVGFRVWLMEVILGETPSVGPIKEWMCESTEADYALANAAVFTGGCVIQSAGNKGYLLQVLNDTQSTYKADIAGIEGVEDLWNRMSIFKI